MNRILDFEDRLAVELMSAIREGDVARLRKYLANEPELAKVSVRRIGECEGIRTLPHILADSPGGVPNRVDTLELLVASGADVNARFVGFHEETPLHWAASNDDVELLDALILAGADIDARGGVIGGGTPLSDAVAFGQWNAARRLVEHGAQTELWHAAALGLTERTSSLIEKLTPVERQEKLDNALWCAGHGGSLTTFQLLLDAGANPNWVGHDDLIATQAALRSGAHHILEWLASRTVR